MTADLEVLARARAFAGGGLSTPDLYEWLGSRPHPISDDLEAELWGLAIAVDAGELILDDARQWVTEKIAPQDEENTSRAALSASTIGVRSFLVSIPRNGRITFEAVRAFVADAPTTVMVSESWWRGVERRPLQAVHG